MEGADDANRLTAAGELKRIGSGFLDTRCFIICDFDEAALS
uniref:Uncharacterized protein n=1 Tax=uncultured bacterium A1Q1_fos_36 TaxID=1256573 RepID=L7VSF2_9BACT|nr:hypothetical protein [uncultured bacterium A1Q1_fos_36]